MKKTNAVTKNSELTSVLNTHFKGSLNLGRVKLISHVIITLCKIQTINFEELANAFDAKVRSDSSLRRMSPLEYRTSFKVI